MKFPFLTIAITGITLGSTVFSPAKAFPDQYFCAQLNGEYHVFNRRERGTVKMLSFVRDVPASWDKRKRCITVSRRFQRFSDHGILRFIGAGEVNSSPVLCAISTKEHNCDRTNVLVTLPPTTNPVDTVRSLMDLRALRRGRSEWTDVSGGKKIENYDNGKVSYDLEVFREVILAGDNEAFLIQEELTPLEDY